jgi:hypothetical protein
VPSASAVVRSWVWLDGGLAAVCQRLQRGIFWTRRISKPFEPVWDGFCAWWWRWLVFMVSPPVWVIALVTSA